MTISMHDKNGTPLTVGDTVLVFPHAVQVPQGRILNFAVINANWVDAEGVTATFESDGSSNFVYWGEILKVELENGT